MSACHDPKAAIDFAVGEHHAVQATAFLVSTAGVICSGA
jgi:hypothetical protein